MAWVTSSLIMAPLALLAVFAAIPPLIIHLRAKNFAASLLIIGLTILNSQNFINAIIWHSTDTDSWWDGKILCDIEVKLYLGVFQALGGAIASIFRQIAIILHPDHMAVAMSPRQRKTTWIIEIMLCIILPIYVMVGHFLTQRTRYWIQTSSGCLATIDLNYAAPFLTYLWLLVVSVIGSIYCVISIVRLYKHRKQMSSVLSRTPGITTSRFYRLFTLSFALLATYGPQSIFAFVQVARIPMHKYSWSHIHPPNWSERIFLDRDGALGGHHIAYDRWAQVITAYLSFLFFGLGQEASGMYKGWHKKVKSFFHAGSAEKTRSLENLAQEFATYEMQPTAGLIPNQGSLERNQVAHPHHSAISELSC
jgi:pheromone a factor receptor